MDVEILHTASGLSHHRGDGVAPPGIVRGFLVRRSRIEIAVDLHKHKPRGIIELLADVEPGNARLANALSAVFDTGVAKGLLASRFHMNVDVNDKHDAILLEPSRVARFDA
jgi:hypothetical protein